MEEIREHLDSLEGDEERRREYANRSVSFDRVLVRCSGTSRNRPRRSQLFNRMLLLIGLLAVLNRRFVFFVNRWLDNLAQ